MSKQRKIHNRNSVRIIGGKWRSRKIYFPDSQGLRPTADRSRETLFNWLAPYIQGANCIDLFAGSGALCFEALSRGAKSAILIDRSPEVVAQLRKSATELQAENIEIYCAHIPEAPPPFSPQTFDIIFVDPPFKHNLAGPSCAWLEKHHCLKPGSLVYFEVESDSRSLPIPEHWETLRHKVAGQVAYYLVEVKLNFFPPI
jgi:16S rRNA (guanine966-N2)-methyltransferase